ncbi:LOW QUALITY PROTEIN: hypothetical protein Cgig2_012683 [Carnegiea gigantea]|uniref:Uncharacterized protein n=1 Tax=Carnegiea gigantea TaxID=171969 RepID=A0A9Q1K016_9CARY|nr:LOW QUALITY PROTEIN: hypothetical protein Cgig2_012683 [Carnegiea gigantea]
MYLLDLLVDEALPLLLPTALSVSCHLLWSGVPSLKDRQARPCLLCIKQKGSQDQKTCRGKKEIVRKKLQLGEPIQRFPVTRLALPPLRALHGLYGLSHKLRDRLRLIVVPYVELEIVSRLSFLSRGFPKGVPNRLTLLGTFPQPSSRQRKRKSYFQCFTFDFFSMAVMNPDLLLKQYHPKSPVSLGVLRMVKRKSKAVVESRVINSYTFRGQLIHGGICLGDHEGIPDRQEGRPLGWGSNYPDHPAGPSGLGPLGTPVLLPQSLALIL